MINWICFICIVLFVGRIMCFFSVSALSELYDEKPAKKTRTRRRETSATGSYAATGTYGKMYGVDYINRKRSI